ncbi:MAG TPA: hypothetical protein DEA96_11445 [Leptospiraceae bacterium]|nr:hypothetical protein [Spirochaetaceae bacterium]HBS05574.1 hypothetical protein [Leptospiraceae bacterium]
MDRFQTTVNGPAMGPLFRLPPGISNVPLVLPLEADLMEYRFQSSPEANLKLSHVKPVQNPIYRNSNRYLSFNDKEGFALQFREKRLYHRAALELTLLDPRRAYAPNARARELDLMVQFRSSRFSFLFDLGHEEDLALNNEDPDQRVSAGFSLGYGLSSRSPVSVLLGLQSRHKITDPFRDNQIVGAQYGTLFFTPGIQFSTNSMILEATLEVPMHTYDLRPDQSSTAPVENDLKARFGMKYFIE